jgi:hypothetical protein
MSKIYIVPIAAALLIAPATLARIQASPLMPHGLEAAVPESMAELVRGGGGGHGGGGGGGGAAAVAAAASAAVPSQAEAEAPIVAARSFAAVVSALAWPAAATASAGATTAAPGTAPEDGGTAANGGPTASAAAGRRARSATSGCAAETGSRMGGGICPPSAGPHGQCLAVLRETVCPSNSNSNLPIACDLYNR